MKVLKDLIKGFGYAILFIVIFFGFIESGIWLMETEVKAATSSELIMGDTGYNLSAVRTTFLKDKLILSIDLYLEETKVIKAERIIYLKTSKKSKKAVQQYTIEQSPKNTKFYILMEKIDEINDLNSYFNIINDAFDKSQSSSR